MIIIIFGLIIQDDMLIQLMNLLTKIALKVYEEDLDVQLVSKNLVFLLMLLKAT